jgi:hypothetical protein
VATNSEDSQIRLYKSNNQYSNNEVIFSYRFRADIFVNSIILEVELNNDEMYKLDVVYHYPMIMEQLDSKNSHILIFRIGNFIQAKKMVYTYFFFMN